MYLGLALLLLAVGIPHAVWPYEIGRFGERLDSIGSKRAWSEVEPAEWNVKLTRAVGIGTVVLGLIELLTG
ncbi:MULTISPECIES: hypothetical protein [Halorubrum]|uniref:DUF6199 domain-containing protein n=1 Tax=Halorubrum hochstenium ATCC 700873 TaxID=1227481 RepID=M0FE84_9EURY|nr:MULTISPECIES: hypothetical protein [Halorubrum]ELZ57643.1 hypothetical protein C467_06302 [Halorubrum hochstenium ATCC 700873]